MINIRLFIACSCWLVLAAMEESGWKTYQGWKVYSITTPTEEERQWLWNLGENLDYMQSREINFHQFPSVHRPAHLAVAPELLGEIEKLLTDRGLKFTVIQENLGALVEEERRLNAAAQSSQHVSEQP